ncbi:MAG: phytoene/squalene synthase family protein [Acidobacteriaceae bacterium]|nr:phytoene/squalene synthase family protein [Acidobacteriaceae bacterium]
MTAQLAAAYAACRAITRASAKNFKYAFLILAAEKRDGLCAVYAFMRHADDLSDEPGRSPAERRQKLDAWREDLHNAVAGQPSENPVLMAVADTQRRFGIPLELFDQLVEGTEMDIAPEQGTGSAPAIRYRTFDDLRRYCYHVASVVGLISIRIFGYRDREAEPLAENCGVAFQLTNIIRDVREDAAMSRVYLPEEDLARFGHSVSELSPARLSNGFQPQSFRPVLEFEVQRARELYQSADRLLPLIDDESRPALWVLIEIYRRLLEKIAARRYDVFTERVRLSTAEKLAVLSRGILRRLTT